MIERPSDKMARGQLRPISRVLGQGARWNGEPWKLAPERPKRDASCRASGDCRGHQPALWVSPRNGRSKLASGCSRAVVHVTALETKRCGQIDKAGCAGGRRRSGEVGLRAKRKRNHVRALCRCPVAKQFGASRLTRADQRKLYAGHGHASLRKRVFVSSRWDNKQAASSSLSNRLLINRASARCVFARGFLPLPYRENPSSC
ncbi:hypothetical protein P3T17_000569 [Paraburkholderia sp. GAS82]